MPFDFYDHGICISLVRVVDLSREPLNYFHSFPGCATMLLRAIKLAERTLCQSSIREPYPALLSLSYYSFGISPLNLPRLFLRISPSSSYFPILFPYTFYIVPFTLPSLQPGYSLFFPSSCPILRHPFLRASSLPLFRSACSFFIYLPAYRPRSSSSFFSMLVLAPSLLSIFLRQPFPLYPTPSKWLLLTSGFYTPEPEVEHVGKFLERERERQETKRE